MGDEENEEFVSTEPSPFAGSDEVYILTKEENDKLVSETLGIPLEEVQRMGEEGP